MGSGKHLRISATGFPGTNETWRFIQSAWREPLNALALLAGDKTVVTGCVVEGDSMSDGFIVLDGEILPFQGGEISENITMIKNIINVDYDVDIDNDDNLDSLPAYESRYLRFGSDGEKTFPYSELKRLLSLQQLSDFELPAYLLPPTYVAFTQALLTKLNGIEPGAQVNVQTDWLVSNVNSPAYLKNRPNNVASMSYTASLIIGANISGVQLGSAVGFQMQIPIPNQGTTDYHPILTVENSSDNITHVRWNSFMTYSVYNKENSSFWISIMDNEEFQNLGLRFRISIFKRA